MLAGPRPVRAVTVRTIRAGARGSNRTVLPVGDSGAGRSVTMPLAVTRTSRTLPSITTRASIRSAVTRSVSTLAVSGRPCSAASNATARSNDPPSTGTTRADAPSRNIPISGPPVPAA
jgi:hypothetical protein